MSDRSVEDELLAEARKFGHSLTHMLRLHAQATNWLERRKVRKQISLALREQRREAEVLRRHQLTWTTQAVDRYRVHVQTVAARANDPSVDHQRRARDAHALAEHRDRLARGFIGNEHLTHTEQGIALDGLDAATVFPQYKTGNLFARAHKVKALEALHYRARVARESASINRGADRERQWQRGLDAARRANAEESLLARIDAAQAHRHRYTAQMTWTDPDGGKLTESRSFATEHTATSWLQRNISGTSWSDGTTLQIETRDTLNAAKQYVDYGRPETVADQLANREAVLRERTLSGQVHHEHAEQAPRQRENSDRERPPETAGVDRLAQVERQLNDMAADRDRLENRVGMLQRGLDSVTADRDQIRRKLDSAEGHIEALKNRNLRLAAEIGELRDRPGVEQLTAERDQLKQERDEAVRKLVQSTPEHERYGNRQRSNGNGAAPEPTAEAGRQSSDTGPVGKRASYLHDLTGTGREQAGPDTQS
ncbi:hypothetical protein IU470_13070 [Nocardia abscessus]|uniref:Uncharacterized protein n=1 Tax=Nocardia abscessus TaxID=120957 RepID=A0ABS0C6N0_9NOCA|nr:hypothetical protein [Nocardia abscessus]MBF6226027.1 hypothetical protein [Nocardia abscessus]